MMKIKILITTLLSITLTGCDKQPEQAAASEQHNAAVIAKLEQSDKKIGEFLDQLENTQTSQEVHVQILCKDFPAEYKSEYMPALLQLEPKQYTQSKLLAELKSALDYYKNKFEIKC